MNAPVPEDLVVERHGVGVLQLTIRRPEVRKALRTQTLAEIAAQLAMAAADDATRVVVLTGGKDVFAAGADLREMAPLGPVEILTHERQRHWKAIATFPKPVVAAVCGYALGAGCELALCCDIVVAGTNARFGQPEVNLGLIPGAGGTARLARTCGKALALQMVLTAGPVRGRGVPVRGGGGCPSAHLLRASVDPDSGKHAVQRQRRPSRVTSARERTGSLACAGPRADSLSSS